uniref:UBA domain-containing protein n=1 Tax=Anopheles culicifacies TaxID=139723 RepID=A0A182MLY9_9DIPT
MRQLEAQGVVGSGRLCGGGESSLNGGAWGSPPGVGANAVGAGVSGWSAPSVGSSQQGQQSWNSGQASMPPPVGPPGSGPRQQELLGKAAGGNGGSAMVVVGGNAGSGQSGSGGWNQVVNPNKPSTSQAMVGQQQQQQVQGANQQNAGPNSNLPQPGNGNPQSAGAAGGAAGGSGGVAAAIAAGSGVGGAGSAMATTSSAKLEHLNSMREALFAQDGWGCQHVNQDTQWDVPISPEPATKPDPSLKATVNNGTELWETNLRNGGQPPVQAPSQKTPWGPQSHHGGTWGVDDESSGEASNVWTGAPGAPGGGSIVASALAGSAGPPPVGGNPAALVGGQVGAAGGWQQGATAGAGGGAGGPVGGGGNGMWQGGTGLPGSAGIAPPKKNDNDWGSGAGVGIGAAGGGSGGWGETRGNVGAGSVGGTGPNTGVPPHLASQLDGLPNVDIRSMRPPGAGGIDQSREFRGDPRGISGRLSGSTSGMLEHYPMGKMPPPGTMSSATSTVGAGNNQWPLGASGGPVGGGVPSNMPPTNKPVTGGGWDDNSPPAIRRNPNIDDGTALWAAGGPGGGRSSGVPDSQLVGRNGRNGPLSGLNAGPIGGGGPSAGPGGLGGGPRMVGSGPGGNPLKSDNSNMWMGGHGAGGGAGASRNGSWDDPTIGGSSGNNWDDKSAGGANGPLGGGASWMDGAAPGGGIPGAGNQSWNANKKPLGGGAGGGGVWPDASSGADLMGNDWNVGGPGVGGGKMTNKPPHGPLEIIRSSKQYRILCEMGYKKEDVEFALRAANMVLEEAVDLLQRNGSLPNVTGMGNASSGGDWRRDDAHAQLGGGGGSGAGNVGGGNGVFEPPFGNRYLGGGAGGGGNGGGGSGHSLHFQQGNQNGMSGSGAGGIGGAGGNPNLSALHGLSSKSLGSYLNQAPPPMGGLGGQGNSMAPFNQGGGAGGGNNAVGGGGGGGQNSVQPTTQLRSLVQQIQMAVQTGYLNPQILNQPLAPQTFLLLNQLLSSIKNSLSEMTLGKEHNNGPYLSGPPGAGGGTGTGGPTSQQSRLNQWKLPSMMDKDSNHDLTDFSRAPGSTAKSVGLGGNGGGGAGGMGGLGGLQSESTWSSGRAGMTDGWPDNASSDLTGKEWPSNQDSFSDLVPEFEPGKPWKGTQMKIEEDPTITPGSIARSPIASISVGSAKDSELFASSSKPSPTDSISLSSSTWSFNASSNNYSSSTSGGGMGKLGGASKNTWSDSGVTGAASDVWGASLSGGSGGPAVNSAAKTPRGPPPGLSSGKSTGSAGGGPGSNGWIQRTGHGQGGNWSGGGGASGTWYSTWLLLKNLTAQVN